jgi:hypothetical protein
MRPSDEKSLPLRARLLLLASQAVNAVCYAGDPSEPLSARAWRERADPAWARRMARIDRWLGADHCMNAFLAQVLREMHRAASSPKTQGSTQ